MTAPTAPHESLSDLLYLVSSDPSELAETVAPLRGADIAEALNALPPEASARVLANLPFDMAAEVLDEPELEHRHAIVERMDRGVAGSLISAMTPSGRADLLRELHPRKRKRVLATIDQPERSVLERLLKFPARSAGGIMTTEFVSVASTATVADALEQVRESAHARDLVYGVYVTEPASGALLHAVRLQDLVAAQPSESILAVGERRPPLYTTTDVDQEDVARIISKYNLLALPVLDSNRRLIGMVTVDDVIDAIVQETTEDVQKFGGLEALDQPYLSISFLGMIQKRAGWLSVLFLGEMLTATAMGYFENEIARAVVLSLFIPLIISSGGNSGSQATSLIIRALALRELNVRDWWKVALRELPAGLTLGTILGTLGVIRVLTWQHFGWYHYGPHAVLIALTIGTALVGVVTFGSLAGSMLPFVMRRLGFDPASASAPFVATLVDVTGLIIYFSVAFLILRGTLL